MDKRAKNRLYWAFTKEIAAFPEKLELNLQAVTMYVRCMSMNWPNSQIVPMIEAMESIHGPARLADVSRPELWQARRALDLAKQIFLT